MWNITTALNGVPGEEPGPEAGREVRHEEEAVDDVLRLAPLAHLVAARRFILFRSLSRDRRPGGISHMTFCLLSFCMLSCLGGPPHPP